MLNDFNCNCPVYIACGYTDLRRGIDGLASMVHTQFQMDPFQTALFLFCGRKRDAHMSHIETGNTKLSLPVLVSLAIILGVRTDDLLFDDAPTSRTSSINEILQILDVCTKEQLLIIEDIVRSIHISLNKHL